MTTAFSCDCLLLDAVSLSHLEISEYVIRRERESRTNKSLAHFKLQNQHLNVWYAYDVWSRIVCSRSYDIHCRTSCLLSRSHVCARYSSSFLCVAKDCRICYIENCNHSQNNRIFSTSISRKFFAILWSHLESRSRALHATQACLEVKFYCCDNMTSSTTSSIYWLLMSVSHDDLREYKLEAS